MDQNETADAPETRKQDPTGGGPGRARKGGSNKIVIAIWVTLLLGGLDWYAYSRQKNKAEAERLLQEAFQLYGKMDIDGSTDVLRQSAELGNVWAQLYYGERLKNGFGTEQNMAEAVKWLRKAARQQCAEAFYQLGVCYENGEGVERDPEEAESWYRKALNDTAFAASAQSALDRIANRQSAERAGNGID